MLEIACIVDAGIGCHGNDDRAFINGRIISGGLYEEVSQSCLAVVCDGVGGAAFGFKAAEIALNTLSDFSAGLTDDITIREYLWQANNEILKAQRGGLQFSQMSTTIAGIYISGDGYMVFNVGDSRVYRFRKPYLAQLSTDHSLIQEMKDLGLNSKPGQEHVITRCLGGTNSAPDITDGQNCSFQNDLYMLCTDGIWDVVKDSRIEEILTDNLKLSDICREMVETAVALGSEDNMSVIIIRRI